MYTTTNLAEFGARELKELRDLLTAMLDHGLPENFYNNDVHPMFNKMSGAVFLTNSEYDVCMVVDGKLEMWYCSPYEGKEGFFSELLEEYPDMHHEDQEWFRQIAKNEKRTDELPEIEGNEE